MVTNWQRFKKPLEHCHSNSLLALHLGAAAAETMTIYIINHSYLRVVQDLLVPLVQCLKSITLVCVGRRANLPQSREVLLEDAHADQGTESRKGSQCKTMFSKCE